MECENVITWNERLERSKCILEDPQAQLLVPLLYLEITDPDNEITSSELVKDLRVTNDLLKACEPHKPEDQNFVLLKNIQEEILKQLGRL